MDQSEINKLVDDGKMIFCFDLDGTLNRFVSNDITKLEVREEVVKILRDRFESGNYIHIYTGRPYSDREKTISWLQDNNIPYHEITFDKPKAHIYIDDSTVDVEDYIIGNEAKIHDELARIKGDEINKLVRDYYKKNGVTGK